MLHITKKKNLNSYLQSFVCNSPAMFTLFPLRLATGKLQMDMCHWCFAQIALQILMYVLVNELKGIL